MSPELGQIRGVLKTVRRRWMWQTIFRCGVRAALSASVVLLASWLAYAALAPRTLAGLAIFGALALAATLVAVVRALWPLTRRPSDVQVARFIEERCPQLEDRLATAVEMSAVGRTAPASVLSDLLYRDAARRTGEVNLDGTIDRRSLARSGGAAVVSALVFAAVALLVAPDVRDGAGALLSIAYPGHLSLHVSPGDTRVVAGSDLRIEVRADNESSTGAPVVTLSDQLGTTRKPMRPTRRFGRFEYIARPSADFKYRVTMGPATSDVYSVTVIHPASVTGIDVKYVYPPSVGLQERVEENGGDVYAPPGTRVHLAVHTDKPVRAGTLLVTPANASTPSAATSTSMSVDGERLLGTELTVSADGSYRVSLRDADGLESSGTTEYFIRVLNDSPPDVRVEKPGSDREVTPLEEVTIAAHADDDRGVKQLDLVYSVRGGPENAVSFSTSGSTQSMDGKTVLYLEDLHVKPGDFVTYYARARDAGNGGRPNEARSDMFFLQVTPFEREFMPPQSSQAASGGTSAAGQSIDALVKAQKEIIVATWRLDRRSRRSRGAGSETDVKTIGRAQGDVKSRAMRMAGPGQAQADAGRDGEKASAEAMAAAVEAMGRAEESLNAVNTTAALPHETRALNELLKAQASSQRSQLMASAGGGSGGETGNADLTSLFDQELKRQQQTNYEMPRGSEQRDAQKQSEALERVRQLAEREGELNRQQQELARNRAKMSDEDVKRQLERLTREQSELRQQAEELSQQMKTADQNGRQGATGQRRPDSGGQKGASSASASRLRDASDAMGQAASNLRQGKPGDASAQSARALDKLRSAEQQMQGGAGVPSLGDLQMQAQEMADTQRRIARDAASAEAESRQAGQNGSRPGDASMRRLAGEKERLADQVERLTQGLKSASASPGVEGRQREAAQSVSKDFDRLQLPKQMRDQAAAMRTPGKGDVNHPPTVEGEQELAKTLGRLADRLGAAAGSREAQQASEQLGATRDARDRLAALERKMSDLQRQASNGATDAKAGRGASVGSKDGKPVGTSGRSDQPNREADMKQLQDEYVRELRRAAEQMNRTAREGGASGLTPEAARALSPLSARGYHQDFSKWQELSREIDRSLERAETVLTKKLRDQQARDRLQAPAADRASEQYRRLVEQYYQSLAKKK